jgi:hypothetical protein
VLKAVIAAAILAGLWSGPAIGPMPRESGGTGFWQPDLEAAQRYARHRPGDVSFAIVGLHSRLRGFRKARTAPAASTIKAMLLAAYLRQPSVRHRPLRAGDRALLEPMIHESDNAAATQVAAIAGARVRRLARAARMRDFQWVWEPGWLGGQSYPAGRWPRCAATVASGARRCASSSSVATRSSAASFAEWCSRAVSPILLLTDAAAYSC